MVVADTDDTFPQMSSVLMEKMIMLKKCMLNTGGSNFVTRYLAVSFAATLILSLSQLTLAQTVAKNFASAAQASQALYEAVRNKDDQALRAILGGPELTSSGDEERDKLEREQFAQKYEEMHRLVREPNGSTALYVGAENWPFPIPLVATHGEWHFDADVGAEEIAAREIGENESIAIEVCKAMTKDIGPNGYKTSEDETPVIEFAQDLVRTENAKSAASERFHGYYFRVSRDRSGRTLLVASPAEYGSSGVMTFVVTGNAVYERDLGLQTATVAQKIQGKLVGKWSRAQ